MMPHKFFRLPDLPYNSTPCISFQVIRMNIERFSVPELLFHPSDIGLEELGIPEAILHSVSSLPEGGYLFLLW